MPYKDPEVQKQAQNEHKAKKSEWLRHQKAVPCMDCGVQYPYWVMQFDHRDPAEKIEVVSKLAARRVGWIKLEAEVAKCDVVCANCHAERTYWRMEEKLGRLPESGNGPAC